MKPGTAQVGAISKAQKYQKDFKMSKYWRIGDPFMKKVFEKSLIMPKKTERGTLWDFSFSILSENIKKLKGDPSVIFFRKISQSRKYSKGVPFGSVELM